MYTGSFQDAAGRNGYFRPDTFAGNKGNFVFDHCILIVCEGSMLVEMR